MELQQRSFHVWSPAKMLLLRERGTHRAGGVSLHGSGPRQTWRNKVQKIGSWTQCSVGGPQRNVWNRSDVMWILRVLLLRPSRSPADTNGNRFWCDLFNLYFLAMAPDAITVGKMLQTGSINSALLRVDWNLDNPSENTTFRNELLWCLRGIFIFSEVRSLAFVWRCLFHLVSFSWWTALFASIQRLKGCGCCCRFSAHDQTAIYWREAEVPHHKGTGHAIYFIFDQAQ